MRTAYDGAHLSRIENGLRPPTRALALACDVAFPERRGWFTDYYDESRQWAEIPYGFRDWARAGRQGRLPAHLDARHLPRAAADRGLRRRPAAHLPRRQRRDHRRPAPAPAWNASAASSCATTRPPPGSSSTNWPSTAWSARPPSWPPRSANSPPSPPCPTSPSRSCPAVAHPANASGFVIADDAAWCEHVASGFVYTDQTVTGTRSACSIPFAQRATAPPRRQHCSKGRPRRMGNWRKSTYSDANGGDCIEVASTDIIMVRDTTDRGGAVLTLAAMEWQRFVASLK